MEPTNRHPLEAITGKSGLSMLELLIPFVDYSLKLPLALFIKFYEIRMILQALRTTESTKKLGLHHPTDNPMELVCALTGISPEILKLLQTFADSQTMQQTSDLFSGMHQSNGLNLTDLLKNLQQDHVPSGFTDSPADASAFSQELINSVPSSFTGTGQTIPDTDDPIRNFSGSADISSADDQQMNSPESPGMDSFEENIQKILASYDLEQAQKLQHP